MFLNLVNMPGVVTQVDDDLTSLLAYGWRGVPPGGRNGNHIYVYTSGVPFNTRGNVLLARLIIGANVGQYVDHISGDTLDNRRNNLRFCSRAENAQNSATHRNSASGIKGVMYERCGLRHRRWRATVVAHGAKHRRWFDTAEQADAWARETRERLHGAFARHG